MQPKVNINKAYRSRYPMLLGLHKAMGRALAINMPSLKEVLK